VNAVLVEVADVSTPAQKPQELMDHRLERALHASSGNKRKTISEIERHHPAPQGNVANPLRVGLRLAFGKHFSKQIQILFHFALYLPFFVLSKFKFITTTVLLLFLHLKYTFRNNKKSPKFGGFFV
jgi:hypothetical protein